MGLEAALIVLTTEAGRALVIDAALGGRVAKTKLTDEVATAVRVQLTLGRRDFDADTGEARLIVGTLLVVLTAAGELADAVNTTKLRQWTVAVLFTEEGGDAAVGDTRPAFLALVGVFAALGDASAEVAAFSILTIFVKGTIGARDTDVVLAERARRAVIIAETLVDRAALACNTDVAGLAICVTITLYIVHATPLQDVTDLIGGTVLITVTLPFRDAAEVFATLLISTLVIIAALAGEEALPFKAAFAIVAVLIKTTLKAGQAQAILADQAWAKVSAVLIKVTVRAVGDAEARLTTEVVGAVKVLEALKRALLTQSIVAELVSVAVAVTEALRGLRGALLVTADQVARAVIVVATKSRNFFTATCITKLVEGTIVVREAVGWRWNAQTLDTREFIRTIIVGATLGGRQASETLADQRVGTVTVIEAVQAIVNTDVVLTNFATVAVAVATTFRLGIVDADKVQADLAVITFAVAAALSYKAAGVL